MIYLFIFFTKISRSEIGEHGLLFPEMKAEESGHVQEDVDDVGGFGLSLSLSLHHPSFQMSFGSSTSEISEAHSRHDSSDRSLEKCSVNLDLSIALCHS